LKQKTTLANSVSAILGAIGLDFALELDEPLRNLVVWSVPALVFILSYLINLLISFGGMSVTSRYSQSSSKDAIDEIKSQLEDEHISPERKEQLLIEYNEVKETVLDMKKGKFKLMSAVHKTFSKNADDTINESFNDDKKKAIESQIQDATGKSGSPN